MMHAGAKAVLNPQDVPTQRNGNKLSKKNHTQLATVHLYGSRAADRHYFQLCSDVWHLDRV